eukprot:1359852-Amphidinium_carterae.1
MGRGWSTALDEEVRRARRVVTRGIAEAFTRKLETGWAVRSGEFVVHAAGGSQVEYAAMTSTLNAVMGQDRLTEHSIRRGGEPWHAKHVGHQVYRKKASDVVESYVEKFQENACH